jgi:hypothetical protein
VNSGTLVVSLIMAGVLALLIALIIQLMMRGWRKRAERQTELIGTLPEIPSQVGPAAITTRGIYCGCTTAPAWNERITAGDLGYRSKAVLTRYPEGILLERIRALPIWIPQESITAIRLERGMAGKVVARIGILAIRWRLPSGVEIDTGFRANHRTDYDAWLEGRQEGVAL